MTGLYFIRVPSPRVEEKVKQIDMFSVNLLFTRLHRAAHGRAFALAPTFMRSGEPRGDTYDLCVFAPHRETLDYMLANPGVQRVLREQFLGIPAVRELHESQVLGWSRYIRDRRQDRASPARLRRQERRAAKGIRKQTVNRSSAYSELPFFHHESTTGRSFGVFVRHEDADGPGEFLFDSFGLSKGGAVPDLRG